MVELCERRNIYLILDDIYHKLIFDRRKLLSPFQFTSQDINSTKLVVINGVWFECSCEALMVGTVCDWYEITSAATGSSTLAHGLSQSPHMVWGVARFRSTVWGTNSLMPYFTAKADSASVTVFNRGESAETFSVFSVFLHSLIR